MLPTRDAGLPGAFQPPRQASRGERQEGAPCRGATDALMAEVIEGHIRFHILAQNGSATDEQMRAPDDLVSALRVYLKRFKCCQDYCLPASEGHSRSNNLAVGPRPELVPGCRRRLS